LIDLLAHFDRERIPERYVFLAIPDLSVSSTPKAPALTESSRSPTTFRMSAAHISLARSARKPRFSFDSRLSAVRKGLLTLLAILEALQSNSSPMRGIGIWYGCYPTSLI
jgi:hypothetical protein